MTVWGFDSYAHVADPGHAYQLGWRVSARYISGVANKDTTMAEQQAVHAAGLDTLINYELQTSDALQGFGAGQQVGRHASAMAHAVGAPTHNPDGTRVAIYYSCDTAATATQVRDYYRGVRSVTDYAVGAYGGTEMAVLLAEGTVDYWWQANAGSWSGHPSSNFATDPAACVRQYVGTPAGSPPNPGFSVDVNEFVKTDCGLWKSPQSQGDLMVTDADFAALVAKVDEIHKAMLDPVDNTSPDNMSGSGLPWAANTSLTVLRAIEEQVAKLASTGGTIDAGALADAVVAALAKRLTPGA